MKNLFFIEGQHHFWLKVGSFPCYFDKYFNWKRVSLAVVRRRNAKRCPKLWCKAVIERVKN